MKKKVSLLCALITLISSLVLTGCGSDGEVRESSKKSGYNYNNNNNSNKAATFEYNKIMDAEH